MLGHLAARFDMGSHLVISTVQLFDNGLLHDLHALFFELLFRKLADLFIFDGEDTIHHLDNSRVCAQGIVKACEFDTDRARPDHQQLFRHMGRLQGILVHPHAFSVCFQPRQVACPRTGRQYDILGGQRLFSVFRLNRHFTFAR